MSTGYQDWITTTIRGLGTPKAVDIVKIVTPNVDNTLTTFTGKGIIWGGNIRLTATASQRYDKPRLNVDGHLIAMYDWDTMNTYGFNAGFPQALLLTKYDDTNYIYCASIAFQIPFMQYVIMMYSEEHGNTPTVEGTLVATLG